MNKVATIEKKPFNYLNPYSNLAQLPTKQQQQVSEPTPKKKEEGKLTDKQNEDFKRSDTPLTASKPVETSSQENVGGKLSLLNMQD